MKFNVCQTGTSNTSKKIGGSSPLNSFLGNIIEATTIMKFNVCQTGTSNTSKKIGGNSPLSLEFFSF